MKTKKINLGGKEIEIKELMYFDVLELDKSADNKVERAKKMFELSGVPKEHIENLSMNEGDLLMKGINELNGFQNPSA